jgi:dGTPase
LKEITVSDQGSPPESSTKSTGEGACSIVAKVPPGCAVGNSPSEPLTSREHPEAEHPYRSAFQRDRGRVIHSRAFRRLAGKTQVFAHGSFGHLRSRLTHTIEVAQLARTVAAALGLNEDLAETLALAHDIGHPPFGHAGERALDDALRSHGLRFDHNLHALHVVEFFEQPYVSFRGLNLTLGVREGILKHSRDYAATEAPELARYFLGQRPPLEAQLIDLADEAAYLTADFDDGFEAGVLLHEHALTHVPLFARFFAPLRQQFAAPPERLVREALKRMLNALTGDLIAETARAVLAAGAESVEDIRNAPERLVRLSPEMESLRRNAKAYLHAHLYQSENLARERRESETIIATLFERWASDPSLLPASCAPSLAEEGVPRTVADYIAGMTDGYILAQYHAIQTR